MGGRAATTAPNATPPFRLETCRRRTERGDYIGRKCGARDVEFVAALIGSAKRSARPSVQGDGSSGTPSAFS